MTRTCEHYLNRLGRPCQRVPHTMGDDCLLRCKYHHDVREKNRWLAEVGRREGARVAAELSEARVRVGLPEGDCGEGTQIPASNHSRPLDVELDELDVMRRHELLDVMRAHDLPPFSVDVVPRRCVVCWDWLDRPWLNAVCQACQPLAKAAKASPAFWRDHGHRCCPGWKLRPIEPGIDGIVFVVPCDACNRFVGTREAAAALRRNVVALPAFR